MIVPVDHSSSPVLLFNDAAYHNLLQIFILQILGILENMSYFKCPNCSEPSYIFGKGGARRTAEEMGMTFLGEVCFDLSLYSYS